MLLWQLVLCPVPNCLLNASTSLCCWYEPNLSRCQTWLEPFAVTGAVSSSSFSRLLRPHDYRPNIRSARGAEAMTGGESVSGRGNRAGKPLSMSLQNLPHLWPQKTPFFHILRRNLFYHLAKIILCPVSPHLLDWRDIHTLLAVGAVPQILWIFYPEESAGRHWTVTFHTWVTAASPDWILSSYICTLVLKAQLNGQIMHLQHCRGQECTISMIRYSAPTGPTKL